jgi:hypothetical protein
VGQTSYTAAPLAGFPGQISDTSRLRDIVTFFCKQSGGILPGRAVVVPVNTEGGHADRPRGAYPAALAAGATAILATGGASSASPQTISGGALNGTVGDDPLDVPAPFTFTFSSSADWDATSITLTAELPDGTQTTELVAIPNNGNATVTTARAYRRFVSAAIPAQTGAGGTFTIGVAGTGAALDARQFLGVSHLDSATEVNASGLAVIAENREGGAVRSGRVFVETDQLVLPRSPVYVRTAGTAALIGVFRGDSDSGNAALLPGAMFLACDAAGVAEVQLDGSV